MRIRKQKPKPKHKNYWKQSKNGSFHFVEKTLCDRCSDNDSNCYLCNGSGYLSDEFYEEEHHYAPVADLYSRHGD